ncbi:hypothetical protein LOTGIDRAFT_118802 [Lottia gigantea]|uniref:Tubulin--tyrosine ligase n=1 Tax=Lottia gigantea TaxID=225164 RepID=V4BYL2_LOTGI|nr:hypothetical protein LOTGIDRAFT_118802 [Lottia gigantea]ESO94229.1 hypothetical protein LOTGIDRAFT_118802 [Lottia gigantea]
MCDNRYIFISRDSNSSVYRALGKYLLNTRKGDWKKVKPDSLRFNLMLGDRNKLPYTRLDHHVICFREMKRHCRCKNIDQFQWFPESFIVIPKRPLSLSGTVSQTLEPDSKIDLDGREELLKYGSSNSESQIWIAKSSSGAKGDGIKISNNIQDLLDHIDHQHQSYIIQKYLHNPFLLNHRRKFDIRCWVLLNSNQQVYLFNQGVLRTASESYNVSDLTNITSHLTNHSLQQEKSKNFGVYEEGNEMFYDEFNEYLLKTRGETMEARIIPQIKDIIKSAFSIILQNLDTRGLDYKSFQLFGFDFLLDDTLKVWLLEINGAPACAQ